MFLIAFAIDIGSTALICATAKPHRAAYRQRLFFMDDSDPKNSDSDPKNSKKHLYESETSEKSSKKQKAEEKSAMKPMIQPPNHHAESGMTRDQSFNNYSGEPILWKYPKVTWV